MSSPRPKYKDSPQLVAKAAKSEVNQALKPEQKIDLLTQMIRIRRFEERSLRAYQQGRIGGFLHLYIGQESVAVGSLSVMSEHDHCITAYRDHGHALAVGMGMDECMAELFGKVTGCSKGKGGSMHFFAPEKRYWGGHGIVAGQTPLGLGLAYALKYNDKPGCCLCYLGDGAINQGVFHESLNLAALWDVPVIYIIENNGYSMGTSQDRSSAYVDHLARRAEGYGMAWESVLANHVYTVREVTNHYIQRAHKERKPALLEFKTYRYRGHSVADANHEKYRTKEEIQEYMAKMDPISVFKQTLIDESVLDEDKVKEIETQAKEEANRSAKFADESDYPSTEAITEDVYWETDHPDQRTSKGTLFFDY